MSTIRIYFAKIVMSAKRNIIIMMCVATVIVGIYYAFFNHADAVDILQANKALMKKHGSLQASSVQRKISAAAIYIEFERNNGSTSNQNEVSDYHNHHLEASKEIMNYNNETKTIDSTNSGIESREYDGNDADDNAISENEIRVNDIKPSQDSSDFDWDGWVAKNDYVAIGGIYNRCDSPDKTMGKVLLMEDKELGGIKTVLVFNITWDHDTEFGTIYTVVKYDNMELYNNKFDLCTVDPELFVCPLLKGMYQS
uniref:Uncharacterized protein LOC100378211 n=1 Tax=Saccoglossus kowalevskii TaxID=10224 RepID=A0ABM0M302_SACKO|nr:PREDICTED: uncharacterized protein LOC100378211 [Saccoglossus kowalevskii]